MDNNRTLIAIQSKLELFTLAVYNMVPQWAGTWYLSELAHKKVYICFSLWRSCNPCNILL